MRSIVPYRESGRRHPGKVNGGERHSSRSWSGPKKTCLSREAKVAQSQVAENAVFFSLPPPHGRLPFRLPPVLHPTSEHPERDLQRTDGSQCKWHRKRHRQARTSVLFTSTRLIRPCCFSWAARKKTLNRQRPSAQSVNDQEGGTPARALRSQKSANRPGVRSAVGGLALGCPQLSWKRAETPLLSWSCTRSAAQLHKQDEAFTTTSDH